MTDVIISQPMAVNIIIYRGDTGRFRVTVTDSGGAPLDVSAASWLCQVRPSNTGVLMTTLEVIPVAGQTNKVDVVIDAAASEALTSSGVWDLQMTLAGEVITLMGGAVKVTSDISRPDTVARQFRAVG